MEKRNLSQVAMELSDSAVSLVKNEPTRKTMYHSTGILSALEELGLISMEEFHNKSVEIAQLVREAQEPEEVTETRDSSDRFVLTIRVLEDGKEMRVNNVCNQISMTELIEYLSHGIGRTIDDIFGELQKHPLYNADREQQARVEIAVKMAIELLDN